MQSVLIAVLALQETEFMIKTLCTHVFLGNTSTQLALAERTVHADGLTENLSAQTAAAVVTGNAEAADQTDLRLLLPPGFQINERDLFPAFQTAEGARPRRNLPCRRHSCAARA